MATNTLVDLVKIYATNTGTSAFVLGAAIVGFRGVEALVDGDQYGYSVRQGSNYEVGEGVYDLASGTLSRGVLFSSAGGSPINLQPNATITFPALSFNLGQEGPPGPPGPEGPEGPAADTSLLMTKAANLADVGDIPTARDNLGLGKYVYSFFLIDTPQDTEVFAMHIIGNACSIAADFAGSLLSFIGTNPTTDPYLIDVQKWDTGTTAFVSIGTISITAAGVVTATTAGSLAIPLVAGDVIQFVDNSGGDASLANASFTLLLERA